jgi:hypothetical protein
MLRTEQFRHDFASLYEINLLELLGIPHKLISECDCFVHLYSNINRCADYFVDITTPLDNFHNFFRLLNIHNS